MAVQKIAEADLCAAFLAAVAKKGGWTAYPEAAGFDILLVRDADGAQIGVEAKLKLNAKVISQALPEFLTMNYGMAGPDYRAVLIPSGMAGDLGGLCNALGIGVIRQRMDPDRYSQNTFSPELPAMNRDWFGDQAWHEWGSLRRCKVPEYVSDAGAGNSAPLRLTDWKIRAIKMAILLEERPVTRADFKALQLNPQRWLDPWTKWLVRAPDADGYIPGPGMPKLKQEHPVNYEQIKADKAKWMPVPALPLKQGTMV